LQEVEYRNGIWFSQFEEDISYPEYLSNQFFLIEESSYWFQHRNNCIISAVNNYPPSDKTVFDVGGGNGLVSKCLQDNGYEAVLIEPNQDGVRNALKRGVNHIVCAPFSQQLFGEFKLSSVGVFDVLEHIKNDADFLGDISHQLENNGKLYITVPAFNFLWSNEDRDANHFRRYSRHSICNLLEQNGFTVEYFTYFFGFLPLPIYLLRTIPSQLGLRKKMSREQTENEHGKSMRFCNRFLAGLMKRELDRIKLHKQIRFGGSCLIVGKKVAGLEYPV